MQMESSPDEDNMTLEIKVDIQLILSALCENDLHRKVTLRTQTGTCYIIIFTLVLIAQL